MIFAIKKGQLERRSLRTFLIIAFVPAWILFALPAILNLASVRNAITIGLIGWSLAMWMPGLGAIVATKREGQKILPNLGLNKLGSMKIYLWAWLTPILTSVAAGVVTWLLGWGEFDPSLRAIRYSLEGLPDVTDLNLSLLVGVQIAASITLGPLFNTIFALGEELGWRGFLLPKLMPLGQIPAMLISGGIWGFWHAPAILQGHNYPDHPILGTGMMIIFTILLGIFLSWLYLKTKSPWAPALGHGTVNAVAGLPLLFLTGTNLSLGGALTSVSGWIVLAALVGIMFGVGELPVCNEEFVSRETLEK
jgi:membrane protease YdiL (CAAX protease family)